MSSKPAGTAPKRTCTLLLDENISSDSIAAPLRDLGGWNIELHGDHFEAGTSDAEVALTCGDHGWAIVTCDDMRYTPETKQVLARHGGRVLKVSTRGGSTHYIEIVSALVGARYRIISLLAKDRSSWCAHVNRAGSVTIMARYDDYGELSESQTRTARKYGRRP
jgi:hypothetical protein